MNRNRIALVLAATALLGISSLSLPIPAEASQSIILPSAARTTTQTSAQLYRSTESSLHVIINVTAYTSGSITPEIDAVDALGIVYPLVIGPAITSTGTTVLKVGNSLGTISSGSAKDFIPDIYQIKVTASGSSVTYSVTLNTGK